MTFIHGYLLAGLALAALPVILHLITRQKPRTLRFPAFRFLQQRHRRNRRRLRLRHLLLLLLRVGLIAGLCLALARPRLHSGPWAASGERPVAAVLVFDTSLSMDYAVGGVSRLDDARRRARELLDEMPEGSQVAVLDSAEEASGGPDWLPPATVPARLASLKTRPANAPLNRAAERGFRLLASLGEGEEVPPRFLYLFSDRARASWEVGSRPHRPEGAAAVWVDVGVEAPTDLAIDRLEIKPPAAAPGQTVQLLVTVRAAGADFDTEVGCRIDNGPEADKPPQSRPVSLRAGQSQVVAFEMAAPGRPVAGPAAAPLHVTARVATSDALPFNNTRHGTFLVRDLRPVLTIVPPAPAAGLPAWRGWELALEAVGTFRADLQSAEQADRLSPRALQAYPVVCVFEALPEAGLWRKLAEYVRAGGGLVVVPGGDEWLPRVGQINKDAGDLLAAPFDKIVKTAPDAHAVRWAGFSRQHPVTDFFSSSMRTSSPDFGRPELWPAAYGWWQTGPPAKEGSVLASFADGRGAAALAWRPVGKGHVLQLTTPLDFRDLDTRRRWHNYWQDSSFGVVLADQLCRFLAGDSTLPGVNFLCGQPVGLVLDVPPAPGPYTLQGPDLALAETGLPDPDASGRLTVPQVLGPGNFSVFDGKGRLAAGFSLDVRPEESDLEKVPAGAIEDALGPGSLLQVGREVSLKEALQGLRPPPVELLPWLLMAVLLGLALESLLANRFYRRSETAGEQAAGPAVSGGAAP
jgi:hypothetical protein